MTDKRLFAYVLGVCIFASGVFAAAPKVSGLSETKLALAAGSSSEAQFLYGFEEYANIRLNWNIGAGASSAAVFYGAFNLHAAAGFPALTAAFANTSAIIGGMGILPTGFIGGENYIAAIELERLYFRVNSDWFDIDTGLMRLAFGYGQAWGPSDFLNPRNPLLPDARPRGVLGSSIFIYPSDTAKVSVFAVTPKNPFAPDGSGFLFGTSGEIHLNRMSGQLLYSYETPQDGGAAGSGIHRGGLSLKADLELGLAADILYTYNHEKSTGLEGLAASAGFDYSFYDGNVYLLAEYLYCGSASDTAAVNGFKNNHYLYGMVTYRFSDYTALSLSCIAEFETVSFVPILSLEHDLFQGLTLSAAGQMQLDRDLFTGNGKTGELGPEQTKNYGSFTMKLRLRF